MPPKRKSDVSNATEAKKAKDELEFGLKWENVGKPDSAYKNVLPMFCLYSTTENGRNKIVGFDIDWTVIATKSGQQFCKNASDWKWLYPEVPDRLKKLNDEGFRLVFFTNQAGIEKGKAKIEDVKERVEQIIRELKIPIFAFVATGESKFRKPSTAMWDYLADNCNKNVKIDLSKSIFVGDAAGRKKDWKPGAKKDFSCSDRKFAANIGIAFKTPEEFFLDEPAAPFEWGQKDPKIWLKDEAEKNFPIDPSKQEVVILIGYPAAGKSTFYERIFKPHGYVHINRDTLKTPAKCLQAAKDALKVGKSVCIDNTNPSKSGRAEFVKLAKEKKIPIRCFYLKIDEELAHHLNMVRQTFLGVRRIPDVGYNVYKKNFEAPTKSEGFAEIHEVDFFPKFDNENHRKIFLQWT